MKLATVLASSIVHAIIWLFPIYVCSASYYPISKEEKSNEKRNPSLSSIVYDDDTTLRRVLQNTGSWIQMGDDLVGENWDFFGLSAGMSSDGMTIVVGAPTGYPSSAYVFRFNDGQWNLLGDKISQDNGSAYSVDISDDGNRVIVGSPVNEDSSYYYSGLTRVYDFTNESWEQLGEDILGEQGYTIRVGMTGDGNRVVIGGDNIVGVYHYDNDAGQWVQIGDGIAGSYEIRADIANDGNHIILLSGGYYGACRVYRMDDAGQWIQVGEELVENDSTRISDVAISGDGQRVIIGDDEYATIYDLIVNDGTDEWGQVGERIDIGQSVTVDISNDGQHVIAASSVDIKARIYQEVDGEWIQRGTDINGIGSDGWGWGVAMSNNGQRIVVGSIEDSNFSNPGVTRVFEYDGPITETSSEQPSYFPTSPPSHLSTKNVICIDSPLRMNLPDTSSTNNGRVIKKRCQEIKESPSEAVLCENQKVKSHCPDACGVCAEYKCSDSLANFRNRDMDRDCEWLRGLIRWRIEHKCKMQVVKKTCRRTCGYCQ